MIKNTRARYTDIVNEGIFMDMKVPELEYFKLTLTEHIRIATKAQVEVSKEHNFNLKITSKISKSYKEQLDNELKNAFKMSWVKYDYNLQQYEYYTSKYTLNSEKLERLQNIFQVLQDFEIYYKEAIKESLIVFNQDVIDKKSYLDHEVAVKFNEEKNCFVIVALRFLGEGKYPILANASLSKGKISDTDYKESKFFDDLIVWEKQKRDLFYFEINPESYIEIKNLIEVKEKSKELYQEKQNEILEKIGEDNLAFFDEDNIFDLKVIYDNKLKMFEFFCKGYTEPRSGNYSSERSLISFLAINHILSKKLTEQEIDDNFTRLEDGSYKSNNFITDDDLNTQWDCEKYKYNLEFEEASDKREKKLYLSLDYNESLKEIINNYEKNRAFFGRKIKEIKIKNNNRINANGNLDRKYPTIYLHDDGRCFYVLGTRETEQVLAGTIIKAEKNEQGEVIPLKVSKGRSGSFTMKTLEISHEEALSFLYQHEWKTKIEQNSIYLNTELWMTNENKPQINYDDRIKSFNILLLNNKLQSDARKSKSEHIKVKKLKI